MTVSCSESKYTDVNDVSKRDLGQNGVIRESTAVLTLTGDHKHPTHDVSDDLQVCVRAKRASYISLHSHIRPECDVETPRR